ncbi:MAG: L-seryl-tRNA(Sec) selenium transferase [Armatimonadetes bacterium]|nr:L-seryl-tRNA(Sec) selenium transferase [Armatimonadota bacterium]
MASSERGSEGGRPPSVDALARTVNNDPALHPYAVRAARLAIAGGGAQETASSHFADGVGPSLKPVINMSGVVLHTGLGRARLAKRAVEAALAVAGAHAAVEFNLESGERGDRQDHVKWLLQELTGAEDALVVNNCAASVVLALAAVCAGSPVLLSRGQMVEIGGQFRMPDIIEMSGCRLEGVGCTNRTHLSDFARAMGEGSGAILRCHQSNFAQIGFVSQPEAKDLADLAHQAGWQFIDDLGSGCLVDTTRYGLPKERTIREAVADGADLVLASGDKLLGGPQAGLIVGKSDFVAQCKRHPLARAFRVDKLTLAGLEATLRLYFEGSEHEIPVWESCSRELASIRRDCQRLKSAWGVGEVREGVTELGGGSFPGVGIPTWRLGLGTGDAALAAKLRGRGLVGRIECGQIWLDPRTANKRETAEARRILAAIRENGA